MNKISKVKKNLFLNLNSVHIKQLNLLLFKLVKWIHILCNTTYDRLYGKSMNINKVIFWVWIKDVVKNGEVRTTIIRIINDFLVGPITY